VLAGLLGTAALGRLQLGATSLYPVLALGIAGLAYGAAAATGASGFLAVYLAGFVIATRVPRHRRAIRSFHNGLASTAQIAVFLVLGLLVFPSRLPGLALPALAVTALLVLLARPLAVAACLTPLGLPWREQLLVGWAGLRGAIPIVLATFALTAGYPDGETIFDLTFFVVLVSTALQGVLVGPMARKLGIEEAGGAGGPVAEALPLDGVEADLVKVEVRRGLHIAGREVDEVPTPPGTLLVAIIRGDRSLPPAEAATLEPGDFALVAVPVRSGATMEVVAWARGEDLPKPKASDTDGPGP
jgi:cell volume regulation protein A